jgi:hypothetical protein
VLVRYSGRLVKEPLALKRFFGCRELFSFGGSVKCVIRLMEKRGKK